MFHLMTSATVNSHRSVLVPNIFYSFPLLFNIEHFECTKIDIRFTSVKKPELHVTNQFLYHVKFQVENQILL